MGKKGKFMILDGNSLVYRAFYAIPLLTTTEGVFTNAVYGFINMLLKIIGEEKPDLVAVAFDKGKASFRMEQYEQYKGHRKPTPDELIPQFKLVKEILSAMNIPVFELEGFEADDLIGTVTRISESEGYFNIIVTGDRDILQLISPLTQVLLSRKGITEVDRYDIEKVKERYGLAPSQIIDLKGLMGDSSDNIPGVPGVGEKTALKLLSEYGSIEEIYKCLDRLSPKLKEKLSSNKDLAFMSRELATIKRDVHYNIDLSKCRYQNPDFDKLLTLFHKLEFRSLTKSIAEKIKNAKTEKIKDTDTGDYSVEYRELDLDEALNKLSEDLRNNKEVGINYELSNPDPMLAELNSFSWSVQVGKAYCANRVLPGQTSFFDGDKNISGLPSLIECSVGVKKYCYDAKKLMVSLDRYGVYWNKIDHDIMVSAYLLNPTGKIQEMDDICFKYLGKSIEFDDDVKGICARAENIRLLEPILSEKIKEYNMEKLYYEVELPLVRILADMEIAGVKVDKEVLNDMSEELSQKIGMLTSEIYSLSGEEFNINSTKQLGYILFEKLSLPVIKKTKTGYSTDVEVLESLAEQHEIVAKILEYRQLSKLKSTYVDGLAALINPRTGKLHTTFNQTVTATGRLSSTEPNLQNIPIRMEEGRRIRKVFVPSEPGQILLSADYSQIELRVLAHLSGDENFVKAFKQGEDIHTHTASEVFGVPQDKVTKAMRDSAKAVNFGIVYGISDYGLAKNIKVSRKEARQYIDGYFARYPGIKEYMENMVDVARSQGYVTTILNRRRYLPDIYNKNRNIRAFGERTAMNTPIQGSAADIIKLAMVKVDRELRGKGFKTKMLLQVHDELIFEVPEDEFGLVVPLIRSCMENALSLKVPLVVDMKKGVNWFEMEKLPR